MKRKLLIGGALVVAVGTALWLWRSHNPGSPAKPPVAEAKTVKPNVAAPPALPTLVFHPVKLVAVGGKAGPSPQTVINPASTVWPDVQLIVDPKVDYHARLVAIDHLPTTLTDNAWESLRQFLLKADPADAGQMGQALKNRLMNALCLVQPPPAGLGGVLTQLYQDYSQNEVIRNYALQHLVTLDEELAGTSGQVATQQEQDVLKILWGALHKPGDSIAGTALLGLERLAQAGAPVEPGRLSQAALELTQNAAAGELTQITAYQVCGQLNVQAALPVIEAAARKSLTIPQQISAIGALGMLGGPMDISLLKSLLQGDEERLKPAARLALERIASRQNQGN